MPFPPDKTLLAGGCHQCVRQELPPHWCRWVPGPTDSVMRHREGRFLSCGVLSKFFMCTARVQHVPYEGCESEIGFRGVAWLFSSGSHSAVVLQSPT